MTEQVRLRRRVRRLAMALTGAAMFLGACSSATEPVQAPAAPAWVEEKRAQLVLLGVDLDAPETRGNYHWRWRLQKETVVGDYRCPAGSALDVSRSILLVIAPDGKACAGREGGSATVKVYPDGSAEPLG